MLPTYLQPKTGWPCFPQTKFISQVGISGFTSARAVPMDFQDGHTTKYPYFVVGLFNRQRVHSGLGERLPEPGEAKVQLNFASYRWQQHCRGLYQTPIAA